MPSKRKVFKWVAGLMNNICGRLPQAMMLFTLSSFPATLMASYAQMKLCDGFFSCGLLAAAFFAIFGVPVAVVVNVFLHKWMMPKSELKNRVVWSLLIGPIGYLLALFSSMGLTNVFQVSNDIIFAVNVVLCSALLLGYSFIANWFLRR